MFESVIHLHLAEDLRGALSHRGEVLVPQETRHHHVFQRVELGKQVVELKDEAQRLTAEARDLVGGFLEDVFALEEHSTGTRVVEGSQDVKQGGLADARLAEDGQTLAPGDLEVRPAQHFDGTLSGDEGLAEIRDLQQRLRHHSYRRASAGSRRDPCRLGSSVAPRDRTMAMATTMAT